MCSTPKMPEVQTQKQEDIASPTYADAKVTKASTNQKEKARMLAGRDIKTSARGLEKEAETEKTKLLGA